MIWNFFFLKTETWLQCRSAPQETTERASYLSTQDEQRDEEYREGHGAHGLQVFPNAWSIEENKPTGRQTDGQTDQHNNTTCIQNLESQYWQTLESPVISRFRSSQMHISNISQNPNLHKNSKRLKSTYWGHSKGKHVRINTDLYSALSSNRYCRRDLKNTNPFY